jgi:hypothetical protein
MNLSKKSVFNIPHIVIITVLFNITAGCFLDSKKKGGKKSGGQAAELILRDSIFFDRLGDRTTARISFKTKIKVLCDLSYGAQESSDKISRTPPRTCNTPKDNPLEFTDTINDLDPNKFYYVFLTVKNSDNPNEVDNITVREPGSPPSANQPSTQANNSPSAQSQQSNQNSISELFVGRIDLVLKAGEVFRHVPKTGLDSEQIRTQLKPTLGCFDQAPVKPIMFGAPDANPTITQLATRDLGNTNATTIPELPGILLLDYPNLNEGIDKWTFMYRHQNKDQIYSSRPIIRFSKVQIASETTYDLDYPNLDDTTDPIKIDQRKDLQIQWSVPPQTPATSYVHVQIGRPTLQKSVYCVFQADQRKGLINSRILGNIQQGSHVISAGLSTILFSPKDRWITITYDWRSGRIEK